ncbi:MAG: DUF72 domain-containing protein [bacterium]|nr:DUF72 domain-containing protein [bacterium]
MDPVHFGTSSWSEKGWVGSFYPRGLAPRDFLSYYATQFDTVEADVTYYRVPDLRMTRGWRDKVPEGFRIAAKFPRSIVHCGEGAQPDGSRVLLEPVVAEDLDHFLTAMGELGAKCGPLVLQFPYFNRRAFDEPGPFLERLDGFLGRLPGDFRYGVEIRNKSWIEAPLVELLRRHGAALVLVDLPYMPHPVSIAKRIDPFTADFTYVRLIGDRKATDALTTSFDEIVLERGASLAKWAEFLNPVVARGTQTFAYANNHFAGHGPATIRELARLLGRELAAPDHSSHDSDQEPPLFRRSEEKA